MGSSTNGGIFGAAIAPFPSEILGPAPLSILGQRPSASSSPVTNNGALSINSGVLFPPDRALLINNGALFPPDRALGVNNGALFPPDRASGVNNGALFPPDRASGVNNGALFPAHRASGVDSGALFPAHRASGVDSGALFPPGRASRLPGSRRNISSRSVAVALIATACPIFAGSQVALGNLSSASAALYRSSSTCSHLQHRMEESRSQIRFPRKPHLALPLSGAPC
jgi:hypothetical protein